MCLIRNGLEWMICANWHPYECQDSVRSLLSVYCTIADIDDQCHLFLWSVGLMLKLVLIIDIRFNMCN